MNFQEYYELTINGRFLKGAEIIAFCRQSQEKNIREIGNFMEEWLSQNPKIKVQTSGSTGIPTILEVEKRQMLESAKATAQFFNFKKGQTALLCLPMSYIAGKMMLVRALFSKLNLICIEPNSNPLKSLSPKEKIHFAPLTPMQLHKNQKTSNIQNILLGGAPINLEMETAFQELETKIYQSYGMAETLSHIAIRSINGRNKSSAYKALPGVKFQKDENDCLIAEVPFLNKPVFTKDIIELKNETEFIWKGRKDNVINSGGIKFYPEEIEQKIQPFISERFFVFPLADDVLGEKICLLIEAEQYPKKQLIALQNNFLKRLNKYEIPKEIFFIEHFQTTNSGKVQRQKTLKNLNL